MSLENSKNHYIFLKLKLLKVRAEPKQMVSLYWVKSGAQRAARNTIPLEIRGIPAKLNRWVQYLHFHHGGWRITVIHKILQKCRKQTAFNSIIQTFQFSLNEERKNTCIIICFSGTIFWNRLRYKMPQYLKWIECDCNCTFI